MVINWDAIGALGEGLGAVAVIVSVLYLAAQIRSQTRESKLSASRGLHSEMRHMLELIALDQEFSVVYQKGLYDYLGLNDNDRMRVSYMMNALFRICEQQFLHSRDTALDQDFHDSSERTFRGIFQYPGVREFWSTSRQGFSEAFGVYVDSLMQEADQMEVVSTFKQIKRPDPETPAGSFDDNR